MKLLNQKFTLFFLVFLLSYYVGSTQEVTNIYVNPNIGNDANDGSKEHPLRSLPAASRLVNESEGENGVTIFLSQGVYALMEPSTFHPTKRKFTKQARLTIRAEVLPDDPNWNTGSMPTLIHTMPLSDDWMGVKVRLEEVCMA